MRIHFSKVTSIVWIMIYLASASHGTIMEKYYKKLDVLPASHYSIYLLTTIHNVKNKMWCGTYCLQYKCECASFIYETQTKSCNMCVQILDEYDMDFQVVEGYVKDTDCATRIPNTDNILVSEYSACSVTYVCSSGYLLKGKETLQCQDNEEWEVFDTTCFLP